MNSSNQYRNENDSLGNILVPTSAYYGPETQRAVENFPISGIRLPRSIIKAQGIIKASAATVNMSLDSLAPDLGKAIIEASEEVVEGKWDEHFVVDVYQAGAGTSQNMNANEVIANRASEIMGSTQRIHPHDHVNMSQSTNDTFPSALNIAAVDTIIQGLLPALSQLHQELQKRADQFMPANAIQTLVTKCISGIQANEEICKKWMEESLSLVTGLSPIMGFDIASQIGMMADEENKKLMQVLQEKGLLTEEVIKAIDPKGMV
jgi:fumarate hydratase class II